MRRKNNRKKRGSGAGSAHEEEKVGSWASECGARGDGAHLLQTAEKGTHARRGAAAASGKMMPARCGSRGGPRLVVGERGARVGRLGKEENGPAQEKSNFFYLIVFFSKNA
jgi:hypothetical protein